MTLPQDLAARRPLSVDTFVTAACTLHPRAETRSATLWRAYRAWADATDLPARYLARTRAWGRSWRVLGCQRTRRGGISRWRGVALGVR